MNITKSLERWYNEHSRHLPWRETSDPYKIWVSEIILQQTRVSQGLTYYNNFIMKFPDVHALASASTNDVLKAWQGLGYYTRAKNLHETAKTIAFKFNGKFPDNYKELIKLKGIGEYTAAAIASFAFNEKIAAVDGNIQRFLSRLYGIDLPVNALQGKRKIQELADWLLNPDNPGKHNQAMMEFGAIQCLPRLPNCKNCPCNEVCVAYLNNEETKYPVKTLKKRKTNRYFHFLIIKQGNNIILEKRNDVNIWKNLYQFPMIEGFKDGGIKEIKKSQKWKEIFYDQTPKLIREYSEYKHVLTHQNIYAKFYQLEIAEIPGNLNEYFITTKISQFEDYPIPRLIEKFIQNEK
ncbi:MAG: A/G-specific adenine glycosylase [Bacteroidia bacterium]